MDYDTESTSATAYTIWNHEMKHIEFPGYILIQNPLGEKREVAGYISDQTDLCDTLHVSNVLNSLFDLTLMKSEIEGVMGASLVTRRQIRWRNLP